MCTLSCTRTFTGFALIFQCAWFCGVCWGLHVFWSFYCRPELCIHIKWYLLKRIGERGMLSNYPFQKVTSFIMPSCIKYFDLGIFHVEVFIHIFYCCQHPVSWHKDSKKFTWMLCLMLNILYSFILINFLRCCDLVVISSMICACAQSPIKSKTGVTMLIFARRGWPL